MQDSIRPSVLMRIEKNPYCVARNTVSIEVLMLLMRHPNADVRLATVCNELMNPVLLSQLASDPDHFVRYSVAIHPFTVKKDLNRLSRDTHALVRKGVSENPRHQLTDLSVITHRLGCVFGESLSL